MNNHNEDYSPDERQQPFPTHELARAAGNIISKFRDNGLMVSDVSLQPVQIPSEQNQHVAVVQAGIKIHDNCFQGLGAAEPADIFGNSHPQTLLDKASVNALANAAGIAKQAGENGASSHIHPATHAMNGRRNDEQSSNLHSSSPRKYRHNPNAPASDNQMKFIGRLCQERNISEAKAREYAGVPSEGPLNSPQANQLIQSIKAKNC